MSLDSGCLRCRHPLRFHSRTFTHRSRWVREVQSSKTQQPRIVFMFSLTRQTTLRHLGGRVCGVRRPAELAVSLEKGNTPHPTRTTQSVRMRANA